MTETATTSPWKHVFRVRIPCVPVGMPRPRATAKRTKTGAYIAQIYNPKTVKTKDGRKTHPSILFKQAITSGVRSIYKGEPITVPVRVDITLVFPRPKNITWKNRPMPRIPHKSKADYDNAVKCVGDALNEIVWADDSLISTAHIEKFVAAGGEQSHIVLAVYEWQW
jgi:Holliday junction resolvase RusA-like endonuclease